MSSEQQRRDAFRVGLPGGARVVRAGGPAVALELRDLSVSGARLVGDASLELGEPVTIAISLDGDAVEVAARVVRIDSSGCAVRFGALAPTSATRRPDGGRDEAPGRRSSRPRRPR